MYRSEIGAGQLLSGVNQSGGVTGTGTVQRGSTKPRKIEISSLLIASKQSDGRLESPLLITQTIIVDFNIHTLSGRRHRGASVFLLFRNFWSPPTGNWFYANVDNKRAVNIVLITCTLWGPGASPAVKCEANGFRLERRCVVSAHYLSGCDRVSFCQILRTI